MIFHVFVADILEENVTELDIRNFGKPSPRCPHVSMVIVQEIIPRTPLSLLVSNVCIQGSRFKVCACVCVCE